MELNKRFVVFSCATILTAMLWPCANALAQSKGSGGRGGTSVAETEEQMVRTLIAPGTNYLKKALINYFDTIDTTKIDDPVVRALLTPKEKIEALRADVLASEYVEAHPGTCKDAYDESKSASAGIGDRGGPICFDVAALALELHQKSQQEILIAMAAVAAHEHQHHMQEDPRGEPSRIAALENEAKALAAYITLTARYSQMPTLQWQLPQQTRFDEESTRRPTLESCGRLMIAREIAKYERLRDIGIEIIRITPTKWWQIFSYASYYDFEARDRAGNRFTGFVIPRRVTFPNSDDLTGKYPEVYRCDLRKAKFSPKFMVFDSRSFELRNAGGVRLIGSFGPVDPTEVLIHVGQEVFSRN